MIKSKVSKSKIPNQTASKNNTRGKKYTAHSEPQGKKAHREHEPTKTKGNTQILLQEEGQVNEDQVKLIMAQ